MGRASKEKAKDKAKAYHTVPSLPTKPPKQTKITQPLKSLQSVAASGFHVLKAHLSKQQRKTRAKEIQNKVLGTGRRFPGHIVIPAGHLAHADDEQRLKDIEVDIAQGTAIVYWADGSESSGGYLGAGVAWKGPENFWFQTYHLGSHTGDSSDAELFAIAAALGRAKKSVERSEQIRLVRVYTDAMGVLEGIAKGQPCKLGPMINPRTALQGVYERTEWLIAQGIKLELIWVKAHAESEGNKWADHAARQAVKEQRNPQSQGKKGARKADPILAPGDAPTMRMEKRPDSADKRWSWADAHIPQTGLVQGMNAMTAQETNAMSVRDANVSIYQETNATTVQYSHEAEAADGSRDRPFVLD